MKFTKAIGIPLVTFGGTAPTATSFILPSLLTQRSASSLPSARDDGLHSTMLGEKNIPASSTISTMPSRSPATSLPNQIYDWRGYQIRYQVTGPADADHTLLLVHGLFVNSDHWRKTLTGLQTLSPDKTCRVYALDLLGSGWSSKPKRDDPNAMLVDGENGRFLDCESVCYRELMQQREEQILMQSSQSSKTTKIRPTKVRSAPTLENIPLGTPSGGQRIAPVLDLRHPLRSPYNFYTWAEQIADFIHDVVHTNQKNHEENQHRKKVTLVANSIGTMSSLQSIIDEPDLFNGAFIINPNFRELHMAEVPFSKFTMPIVRRVQSLLRENGHGLFQKLANPDTVTQILKEPYKVSEAIDEELVSVLLDPLLTEGADDVVFDTLSYSAGPLPEQQLSSPNFPKDSCPVWVIYGKDDPWTPEKRVEKLKDIGNVAGGKGPVERIIGLEGVGHCPHDESPEVVNKLIWEFLDRLKT